MANHLTPKLRFSPVLVTVILSILLVSAATIWPAYQQHQKNAIQEFNQKVDIESEQIKALLSSVINSKTESQQKRNLKKALAKLEKSKVNASNKDLKLRFLLIENQPKKKFCSDIIRYWRK
jgi:type II secretory pathway pseudopilin PulG